MTIATIHKTFKMLLDKNAEAVSFGGCPAFLPKEIDAFLNQAYLEIISNKFTGNTSQISFEQTPKRIADLENLVKTDTGLTGSYDSSSNVLIIPDFTNGTTYQRMFYVNAVLHFTKNSELTQATCVLTDHLTANGFLKTHSNDPWLDNPMITLYDNKIKVYVDSHEMKAPFTLDLTYIKQPEKIDYTTPTIDIDEVPDNVMHEVINRAVLLALDNIESQRINTKSQINNLQE